MSTKIYCYKSFSNYFNLEVEANTQQENNINEWTAHLIKFNKKQRVLLVNHKTFFYIVLDDVSKSDIDNFNKFFLEGLLAKVKGSYELNENEITIIKEKLENISFYDKSKDGNLNYVINNFVSSFKNCELLDYVSFEEFYSDEELLNDDATVKNFITQFQK